MRNIVKDFWSKEKLPIGSYVRLGGEEYRFEAVESEVLDHDEILRRYDDEEISREQFLRMIKVDKKEAGNVLGGDEVADLTRTIVGKTVDIRVSSLPVDNADDEYIGIKRNIKTRRPRIKFGGSDKAKIKTPKGRIKRRVKVRNK